MNFENFARKITEEIKEKKISPHSRWYFLVKDYFVWILGILSLFIGALAFSIIIYFLKYSDLDIHGELHESLGKFILLIIPYFWIILLILFILALYYNLKHTKNGYRYQAWKIVFLSVLLSIILGTALFLVGYGQKLDDILGKQVPLYSQLVNPRVDFWFKPDEGRLLGLVSKYNTDQSFNVIDPSGKEWKVDVRLLKLAPNHISLSDPLNIIGKRIAVAEFQAYIIKEVHPGRQFLLRNRARMFKEMTESKHCSTKADSCSPFSNQFRLKLHHSKH